MAFPIGNFGILVTAARLAAAHGATMAGIENVRGQVSAGASEIQRSRIGLAEEFREQDMDTRADRVPVDRQSAWNAARAAKLIAPVFKADMAMAASMELLGNQAALSGLYVGEHTTGADIDTVMGGSEPAGGGYDVDTRAVSSRSPILQGTLDRARGKGEPEGKPKKQTITEANKIGLAEMTKQFGGGS